MIKKITGIILAAALLIWGTIRFIESRNDEAQIRKTLQSLCGAASKPMNESTAAGALKLQRLDKFVTPKFRLNVNHGAVDGTMTPAELSANIARVRPVMRWMTISMQKPEIAISGDGQKAQVYFTCTLTAVTKKTGSRINEARDLYASMQKTESGWLVAELAINDILEK